MEDPRSPGEEAPPGRSRGEDAAALPHRAATDRDEPAPANDPDIPPRDPDVLLAAAEARRTELAQGAALDREVQLIHFDVGHGRAYGLPLESAAKIERVPRIVPVPRTPPYVRGIASLRGEIVCVVDLAVLLGLPISDTAPRGLLVLQDGPRKVAILSETLPDFLRVKVSAISPPPAGGPGERLLAGVLDREEGTIAVLVPGRLLDAIAGER